MGSGSSILKHVVEEGLLDHEALESLQSKYGSHEHTLTSEKASRFLDDLERILIQRRDRDTFSLWGNRLQDWSIKTRTWLKEQHNRDAIDFRKLIEICFSDLKVSDRICKSRFKIFQLLRFFVFVFEILFFFVF
jgi:hypothetical protein